MKKIMMSILILINSSCANVYNRMEAGYQNAQDPVRMEHAKYLRNIVLKYKKETGDLPLRNMVVKEGHPFMVFIGRTELQEDRASKLDVMKRNAGYINSKLFESILSEGLGEDVKLPRDPQLVATFAPQCIFVFCSRGSILCRCTFKFSRG